MAIKHIQTNSVIGQNSAFYGKFKIKGPLQINGRFEGDINTDDQLIIGESGKVKTNVVADRVIVGGTLVGNIEAKKEVVILETGKVLGNITTPSLIMYQGVIVKGEINVTSTNSVGVEDLILNSLKEGVQLPEGKKRKLVKGKESLNLIEEMPVQKLA